MKFSTTSTLLVFLAAGFLLINSTRDPNNPQNGNTGAPGEQTCAKSGCHSGGSYTGTVNLSGVPDTVVVNQTYNVSLTNASNAPKAGFQLTCLTNGTNAMSGSLISPQGSGVNIGSTSNGRKYARQASPKLASQGAMTWNFQWKAPATGGVSATFYYVSLCANNNNGKTGDNVVQATKQVYIKSASVATNTPEVLNARIYPTLANDVLNIELEEGFEGNFILFSMEGKPAMQASLKSSNTLDISQLPKGVYTAHISGKGRSKVQKIVVE